MVVIFIYSWWGYKPTYYFFGHYIVQEHIRFHGEKETCFLVTLWQTNITMENHNFSWANQLFLWPFSMSQTVSLPEGKIFPSTNDWLIHTWINPLISNTTIYMVPNRCRSSTSTMVSGVCFIWIRTAWLIWLIIYNVYIYIYTNRYDIVYIYIYMYKWCMKTEWYGYNETTYPFISQLFRGQSASQRSWVLTQWGHSASQRYWHLSWWARRWLVDC